MYVKAVAISHAALAPVVLPTQPRAVVLGLVLESYLNERPPVTTSIDWTLIFPLTSTLILLPVLLAVPSVSMYHSHGNTAIDIFDPHRQSSEAQHASCLGPMDIDIRLSGAECLYAYIQVDEGFSFFVVKLI